MICFAFYLATTTLLASFLSSFRIIFYLSKCNVMPSDLNEAIKKGYNNRDTVREVKGNMGTS